MPLASLLSQLTRLTPKVRRLAALVVLAACVGVVALRHGGHANGAQPLRVAPVVARAAPAAGGGGLSAALAARASPGGPQLVVDVVGAVRRQGLVRLPRGSRVADAIARAGGLTKRAVRLGVNLAAPVADGEQVLVPQSGAAIGSAAGSGTVSGASSGAVAAAAASPAAPISLSIATAEQLDTLPGIGPVTAEKIVSYRAQHGPFTSVDGLDAIPGIGPARIAELQGLVEP